jgi:hypothetical protein
MAEVGRKRRRAVSMEERWIDLAVIMEVSCR